MFSMLESGSLVSLDHIPMFSTRELPSLVILQACLTLSKYDAMNLQVGEYRGEAGLNDGLVGEYRGEVGLNDGDCGL